MNFTHTSNLLPLCVLTVYSPSDLVNGFFFMDSVCGYNPPLTFLYSNIFFSLFQIDDLNFQTIINIDLLPQTKAGTAFVSSNKTLPYFCDTGLLFEAVLIDKC